MTTAAATAGNFMLDSDEEQDQLIREFQLECDERLEQLDRDLACLDEHPTNIEALSGVFRTFHTIKGTAGFFAFHKLASIAHAAEGLSIGLRDGLLDWNPHRAVALRHAAVMLRRILASIAATRAEGDADCASLLEDLGRLKRPDDERGAARRPDR